MNEQAHILITGRDPDLLAARGMVLQTAGHRVSTTMEPIGGFPGLESVQLLIVCHTLKQTERQDDLDALGAASQQTKALCIEPHHGQEKSNFPTLNSFAGPREMVRVVNRLLSTRIH